MCLVPGFNYRRLGRGGGGQGNRIDRLFESDEDRSDEEDGGGGGRVGGRAAGAGKASRQRRRGAAAAAGGGGGEDGDMEQEQEEAPEEGGFMEEDALRPEPPQTAEDWEFDEEVPDDDLAQGMLRGHIS